ncbi:MAG TPA: PAS domain-containing protein [Phycisphaerales bacterium]|nr:PAS domain-containing protein [Phycisphaerales bacterium]
MGKTTKTRKPGRTTVLGRQATGVPSSLAYLAGLPIASSALVIGVLAWRAGQFSGIDPTLLGVGVVPIVASVVLYRKTRRQLSQLAAVGEAVGIASSGTPSETELLVDETVGPIGLAWNTLVQQKVLAGERGLGELHTGGVGSSGAVTVEALDGLPHAVCVLDSAGVVVVTNKATKTFVNAPEGELVGSELGSMLDESASEAIDDVLQGRVRRRNSVEIVREDQGSRQEVLRLTVSPIRGGGGIAAVVTIEDITRQRLAERSRHEFLAQATHELRTPLTNIRLYVDEAIESGDSNMSARLEALNVIANESLRLERIVGELLNISELEAGARVIEAGDMRMDQMLADLQSDYEALAQSRGIELSFELPPKIPVLRGDRDKVMSALQNLVGNAVKYTPNGGSVRVQVEDDAHELKIAVNDTGIGISQDEQDRVFEKFFRSGDERVSDIEGTGLGLAFAKQVAQLHGGDLSLDSELNRGSTFTLSLPKPKMAA